MRFHFCGKSDCPDWVLAQLFRASSLELDKFKLICCSVKSTLLAQGNFDTLLFELMKLPRDGEPEPKNEIEFDIDDTRACFAAVDFIMRNSNRYSVDEPMLNLELLQLGLPQNHSNILCNTLYNALSTNENGD